MPGTPNDKVLIGATANRETTMLTNANMKLAMKTQDGLESMQKLITRNTAPPVECSLAAITAWINGLP